MPRDKDIWDFATQVAETEHCEETDEIKSVITEVIFQDLKGVNKWNR